MNKIYHPCHVVAEACCNHLGKIDIAKEMIKSAKLAGADYIKFQKRTPELAIPRHMHDQPHPCPANAFGETYLEHRKFLEFDLNQHQELFNFCQEVGIQYSCSVWDVQSVREIISLKPSYIKVPSAINNHRELINILYNEYDGDVHISLGMTTNEEMERLFEYLLRQNLRERTVLYWTTSDYPAKFEELFLLEIEVLVGTFHMGFSGHNLGIAADIAAYTLGCSWIERHFTLDRTWKGTDHAPALEPMGLQKLCRDLKAVHKALAYKTIDMTKGEITNRKKLKFQPTNPSAIL